MCVLYDFMNSRFNIYVLLSLLLICVMLVLTQSKSVYISTFVVTIALLLYNLKLGLTASVLRRIILILTFFTLGGYYIIFFYSDQLGNIVRFINFLVSSDLDGSTATRLNQLYKIELITFKDFLFGSSFVTHIIENNYGYKLANFGFFGLSFLLLLVLYLFYLSKKIFISDPCGEYFAFYAIALSLPIFMLGSSPLDGPKHGCLLITLIGYFLATYRANRL